MEAVSAMLRQLDSQKKEAQKRLAELSVQVGPLVTLPSRPFKTERTAPRRRGLCLSPHKRYP